MKPVIIVGAGFSGLTLAYHLRRQGLDAVIYEKDGRAGGLLDTIHTDLGLAETAANSILADADLERMFEDLGVPFATQLPERKKRFVFWDRPRRWPLTPLTTAKLVWLLGQVRMGSTTVMPGEYETVNDWSIRVMNAEFEQRLLSPALQGVFAGDPKRLSASLTLAAMLGGRAVKGKQSGSVAPAQGMGQLVQALHRRLEAEGVPVHFNHEYKIETLPESPVVVCTSAWTAAEITNAADPHLSEQLRHCESLPLVSVTCVFEVSAQDLKGFGCLFPPSQGFNASGVIFNDCVFQGRSKMRSETWIFGGALQLGAAALTDEQLAEQIEKDRRRLMPSQTTPLQMKITRWPRAIPHYTVQWEKFLKELTVPRPLFLHGNYLGGIGLSRIHQRSIQLAGQLKELYGA